MSSESFLFSNFMEKAHSNQPSTEATTLLLELPVIVASTTGRPDAAIDLCLARTGAQLDASRLYVMLNENKQRYLRNTHEWVNSQPDLPSLSWPLYDYDHDLPSLKNILNENEILAGHFDSLPPDLQQILHRQGVQSIVVARMVRDGEIIGLVRADYCSRRCDSFDEPATVLRYLANVIVVALERKELYKLRLQLQAISNVLSNQSISEHPQDKTLITVKDGRPVTLQDAERRIIVETLELYNGNKLKTARHLGLTWPSLDRRCKKLGIEVRKR